MRNWVWVVAAVGLIAVVIAAHGADEPKKSSGVFSMLKVGQTVTLRDEGTAFSISFLDEERPLAHKVIEIGNDHIVLEDVAGVTETAIPVYAVKSVVKINTKGK